MPAPMVLAVTAKTSHISRTDLGALAMNSSTVLELSSMTLGSVGVKVGAQEGPVLAAGLPDVPGEPDLVHDGNGHLQKKAELTGRSDKLAVYVHRQLGLGDEGSFDAYFVDEGGERAVVSQDDLCASVVDVGAEGAGLGAASGNLLFFKEQDVSVPHAVGGGEAGEATAHYYNVEEGIWGVGHD